MNRRHLNMGLKLLRNTRFNSDFLRYLANQFKLRTLNKHKDLIMPYPDGLMLELGNRCNLHCIICPREYSYGKQMDQGFMPLERAKAIVDELYPYLHSIGLTGLGETMLYPHFAEIVHYIKQKKKSIQITISTNAHLPGFAEKIIPLLPELGSVQFSVDGIGKVYETIRPNTDFSIISENIRQVVKAGTGTEFVINTIITKENYTNLPEIVKFASSVGVPFVNFNRINLASIPEQREKYKGFFTGSEYKRVSDELSAMRDTYKGISLSGYRTEGEPQFQDCIFPWKHHYITWNGFMVPCCAKPFPKEWNFGNVFEKGVMAVLNGEKAQAFRRMWQLNQAPAFCRDCNNINL